MYLPPTTVAEAQMTLQRTVAAADVCGDANEHQRHQPYLTIISNNNNNDSTANKSYHRKRLRPTVSVFSVSLLLVLLLSTTVNLSTHISYCRYYLDLPQQHRLNGNVGGAGQQVPPLAAITDYRSTAQADVRSQCHPPEAVEPLLTLTQLDRHLQDEGVTYTTGTNRNLPTSPTLANYISFHSAQLRCLTSASSDNAACATSQNRASNGVLVWECSHARCGGVGTTCGASVLYSSWQCPPIGYSSSTGPQRRPPRSRSCPCSGHRPSTNKAIVCQRLTYLLSSSNDGIDGLEPSCGMTSLRYNWCSSTHSLEISLVW